jgi:hypothetical protein
VSVSFEEVVAAVVRWCEAHGIRIEQRPLPREKAGEFTGKSIVMNSGFLAEDRLYYLTHAIGSIVRRSLSPKETQELFDELRDAKQQKQTDPQRLERAIDRYRAFETESSEYAVWLLNHCGYPGVIGSYTNFMWADLEAMTQLHRTGRAPVWPTFFRQWNDEVTGGRRQVPPFQPKSIPSFDPIETEKQDILQRQNEDEQ